MRTGITLNDVKVAARRFRKSSNLDTRVSDLEGERDSKSEKRKSGDDYEERLPLNPCVCGGSFQDRQFDLLWLIILSVLAACPILNYFRKEVFGCLTRYEQAQASKNIL